MEPLHIQEIEENHLMFTQTRLKMQLKVVGDLLASTCLVFKTFWEKQKIVLETLWAKLTEHWRHFGKCPSKGGGGLLFAFLVVFRCGRVIMKNSRKYAASQIGKKEELLGLLPTMSLQL